MVDVTGRDGFILRRALLWAVAAIDQQPERLKPFSDRNDMVRILRAGDDQAGLERNASDLAADTGWPCVLEETGRARWRRNSNPRNAMGAKAPIAPPTRLARPDCLPGLSEETRRAQSVTRFRSGE